MLRLGSRVTDWSSCSKEIGILRSIHMLTRFTDWDVQQTQPNKRQWSWLGLCADWNHVDWKLYISHIQPTLEILHWSQKCWYKCCLVWWPLPKSNILSYIKRTLILNFTESICDTSRLPEYNFALFRNYKMCNPLTLTSILRPIVD